MYAQYILHETFFLQVLLQSASKSWSARVTKVRNNQRCRAFCQKDRVKNQPEAIFFLRKQSLPGLIQVQTRRRVGNARQSVPLASVLARNITSIAVQGLKADQLYGAARIFI